MKALPLIVHAALRSHLAPRLATDAVLDLRGTTVLATGKASWAADKAKIVESVTRVATSKLAKDADLGDLISLLDQLDDVVDEIEEDAPEETDESDDIKPAAEDEDDEDKKKDEDDDDKKKKNPFGKDKKGAKDKEPALTPKQAKDAQMAQDAANARNVKIATDAAVAATTKRLNEVREAERFVAPWVGEVAAMDSAHDVYRFALDGLKVDVMGVTDTNALKLVLSAQPKPGDVPTARPARQAADSGARADMLKRFPGAGLLK
jgi:hypothetical protein